MFVRLLRLSIFMRKILFITLKQSSDYLILVRGIVRMILRSYNLVLVCGTVRIGCCWSCEYAFMYEFIKVQERFVEHNYSHRFAFPSKNVITIITSSTSSDEFLDDGTDLFHQLHAWHPKYKLFLFNTSCKANCEYSSDFFKKLGKKIF